MRMRFGILLVFGAVLSPTAVFGQESGSSGVRNETPEEEKTVQLVLYPAPEPRPALTYKLLPPFLERRPGNAAVWWNRIFADYTVIYDEIFKDGGAWEKIAKWMEIPLSDPRENGYREKEYAQALGYLRGGGFYNRMERAARFESCDWESPMLEGNVITVDLSDVQETRRYARLLSAKARLEIAEGKYAEAARTLQTGYALARHVSEQPTFIGSLIAVADAEAMSNQVEQWIQRPDGPNLYWALSALPRPLVDFRLAGEEESNFIYFQSPELRDLDKKSLSPEGWRDLLQKTVADFSGAFWRNVPQEAASAPATMTVVAIQGYPRAKRYLIECGRSAAEVEAMPVAQVILLYSVRLYSELSDAEFKWFYLPMSEGGRALERANRDLRQAMQREILPFTATFLPAAIAAKRAETRQQWKLNMLRIFEAMRLYAASHDGRWPDQLSDITEVPIPTNPFDGKPFIYERRGEKAILTSEMGPGG